VRLTCGKEGLVLAQGVWIEQNVGILKTQFSSEGVK
jgi:hypothetical protein